MRKFQVVTNLEEAFTGSEFEGRVFVVGGACRDFLLGLEPKDFDVVVEGEFDAGLKAAEHFAKFFGVYKEGSNPVTFPNFGTAKVSLDGLEVEFVATRSEVYDGLTRKPECKSATLLEDLKRRDFNLNTLVWNVAKGMMEDHLGTSSDMSLGWLNTPCDPMVTFTEDPLRMLRGVRFAVKYNLVLVPRVADAMVQLGHRLDPNCTTSHVSRERVRDELNKMMVLPVPSKAFQLMLDLGLLRWVLPSVQNLSGCTQNKYHHKDVFGHTMDVLDGVPADLETRLAALFHDVGKPATRTSRTLDDFTVKVQFIGHDFVGAEMAKKVLTDLKYPSAMVERVSKMVLLHMAMKNPALPSTKSLRKFAFKAQNVLEPLLDVMHSDNMAHAPDHQNPTQVPYMRGLLASFDLPSLFATKSLLNGERVLELMEGMGFDFRLEPSLVGSCLRRLVEMRVENPDMTVDNAEKYVKSVTGNKLAQMRAEAKKKV